MIEKWIRRYNIIGLKPIVLISVVDGFRFNGSTPIKLSTLEKYYRKIGE